MSKRLKLFLGVAIITFGVFSYSKITNSKPVVNIESETEESKKNISMNYEAKVIDCENTAANIQTILKKGQIGSANENGDFKAEYDAVTTPDGVQEEFDFEIELKTKSGTSINGEYIKKLSISKSLASRQNNINLEDSVYAKDLIMAISNNEINFDELKKIVDDSLKTLNDITYNENDWKIAVDFEENEFNLEIEVCYKLENEKKINDGIYELPRVESDSEINAYVEKLEIKDGIRIYDIVVENNTDDSVLMIGGEHGGYITINDNEKIETPSLEVLASESGKVRIEIPNEKGNDIKKLILTNVYMDEETVKTVGIKNSDI